MMFLRNHTEAKKVLSIVILILTNLKIYLYLTNTNAYLWILIKYQNLLSYRVKKIKMIIMYKNK